MVDLSHGHDRKSVLAFIKRDVFAGFIRKSKLYVFSAYVRFSAVGQRNHTAIIAVIPQRRTPTRRDSDGRRSVNHRYTVDFSVRVAVEHRIIVSFSVRVRGLVSARQRVENRARPVAFEVVHSRRAAALLVTVRIRIVLLGVVSPTTGQLKRRSAVGQIQRTHFYFASAHLVQVPRKAVNAFVVGVVNDVANRAASINVVYKLALARKARKYQKVGKRAFVLRFGLAKHGIRLYSADVVSD